MLMPLFSPFPKLLFSPDDAIGNDGPSGKESLVELLSDDKEEDEEPIKLEDEKKEETEEDEETEEKEDEEKDELDEIEEELKEPDEDKLELTTPVRRKEILSKYPKLFKDFPYLEKAYYREQQFTQIVPTIEDAREAVAKANVLDQFGEDLNNGDIGRALQAVKGYGEEAFNSLVDNYLGVLRTVDKDAHLHVVGNVIREVSLAMSGFAKESNNEELQEAAKILNRFVFGKEAPGQPTALSKPKEKDDKAAQLEARERQILKNQFESARDSLNTKVSNKLKATIADNIDPRESMTEYVKKNAVRDCQERLESLLEQDTRLGALIDKLWEPAFKDGFSQASLDRIRTAYLSRAKTLLPTVIKQARNEALKGIGKRVREDNEDDTPRKGPLPAGRTATSSNNGGKTEREKAKAIPAGMSTREFLEKD